MLVSCSRLRCYSAAARCHRGRRRWYSRRGQRKQRAAEPRAGPEQRALRGVRASAAPVRPRRLYDDRATATADSAPRQLLPPARRVPVRGARLSVYICAVGGAGGSRSRLQLPPCALRARRPWLHCHAQRSGSGGARAHVPAQATATLLARALGQASRLQASRGAGRREGGCSGGCRGGGGDGATDACTAGSVSNTTTSVSKGRCRQGCGDGC